MSGRLAVPVTVTDSAGAAATVTATCTVNDSRVGACIDTYKVTYAKSLAAFGALTGLTPLPVARAELGSLSPMPTSYQGTYLVNLTPATRLVIDLCPAPDGSDAARFAGFCESLAGRDWKMSLWHEPSSKVTAAQFASVYAACAPVIRANGGKTVYCLDSYEIAVRKLLAAYYPGDSLTDEICGDFYISNGLAALPLAAQFAALHGKPLGACEVSVQSNQPADNNYGTQAQNLAYLAGFQQFFAGLTEPVADITYWQGFLSGEGDFRLASNAYAVPAFQSMVAAFNTTGQLAA